MSNLIVAFIFCIVAFVTGLSIAFTIMSKMLDEEKMFYSLKNTIVTYVIGFSSASLFTVLSFYAVCDFQSFIRRLL